VSFIFKVTSTMPRTSNRLGRISDQLKQELALLIQNELRDPRLGMVSVLDVKVSKDLAHADVFITVLGAEAKGAVDTLNKASGFLRSLLAKNLNLRVTPRLRFVFDESVERGRKLSSLIDEAVAQDAKHDHSSDGQ
jgi:ribosome-binding factor A